MPSGPPTAHLLSEFRECSRDGHPGGVRRGLAQDFGNLGVRFSKFDSRQHCFTFLGRETLDAPLVPFQHLASDYLFDDGGPIVGVVGREWLPPDAAGASNLVPEFVVKGCPQVGEECAVPPRFESFHLPEGVHDRFLHKVIGVAHIARPSWQSPMRPAFQRTHVALEQIVQRALITRLRACQQDRRRFGF